MSIRFTDEQGRPAEYAPAKQPPYHLLVVGKNFTKAYDKDGHEVNPRTGEIIKATVDESLAPLIPAVVPRRRPGRPRENP